MTKRYFTLLELVLATTVLMMIMVSVAMAFTGIYRTWAKMVKLHDKITNLLLVDRIADGPMRNAVPFSWKDQNKKDRFIFKGDPSELVFSYFHRINEPEQGGLRFLILRVENGALVAEHRKTPILWWENDNSNLDKEIIMESLRSISFLYADLKGGEIIWLEDWDEENAKNIPLAVQMRLEWDDGTQEVWLRRTAGSGFRETHGVRRSNL
jgi:type II secretory pathway component PulJ